MTNSRSAVFLVALAVLRTSAGTPAACRVDLSSAPAEQQRLSLDFANDRQRVAARVGQQIEITLGTAGPNQYGTPQVSSPALKLEGTALSEPPTPGGRTYIYIFEAVAEGDVQVQIPLMGSDDPDLTERLTFTITVHIKSSGGKPAVLDASRMVDQANTAAWTGGSTVFAGKLQTFTPSLPWLTAIEVELVVANPGPLDDQVTMSLWRAGGGTLASVSKSVTVADCSRVLFILPGGGVRVSPGQVYNIELSGGNLFGWKYVVGGYKKGAAVLRNSEPIPRPTRTTFLFRTFGSN